MTQTTQVMSRRESWPPTQIRLMPSMRFKKALEEPRPLLEDIDENPLTYFLTPSLDDEDGDMDLDDDCCMDFDAGIEDSNSPREIVRSVSPSSLEALRKAAQGGAASPDLDSDGLTTDDDEDEDYIRFSPSNSVLSPLRDLALEGLRFRARNPVFGLTANALLSPNSSFPGPSGSRRGRSNARRSAPRRETRSLSARSRPNHLWREPSPDVWSIEEETEEEMMMSESGSDGEDAVSQKSKSKKRVRFVLPVRE